MNNKLPAIKMIAIAAVFFALGYFISNERNKSERPLATSDCTETEPFLPFIKKFNDDIQFQKHRTLFPLIYVTYQEDNPEKTDTFLIERNQWEPLFLFESAEVIMKIVAGGFDDSNNCNSCEMTVVVEGINYGDKVVFRFLSDDKRWYLTTFENYSL